MKGRQFDATAITPCGEFLFNISDNERPISLMVTDVLDRVQGWIFSSCHFELNREFRFIH